MINPVNEITSYNGDEWQSFLDKIALAEVFQDLINTYGGDANVLRSIIHYIVWTYSLSSEKVSIGGDWTKTKKNIFFEAGVPNEMWGEVAELKEEAILKTVKRWLTFQNNETYMQLCMLKDLRQEMQIAANTPVRKSSGEIDYDMKYKCATYSKDLLQMIRDEESNLIQNHPKLKDAVREVKKQAQKHTLSVESFAI